MNVKSHIISFFGKTCTACVGLSLLFYIVMAILSETSLEITSAIPFGQFLLLLLAGALLTGAGYLFLLPLSKASRSISSTVASPMPLLGTLMILFRRRLSFGLLMMQR
jgi:hypothetical protein